MIIMKKKFSIVLIVSIIVLLFGIFVILLCTRTNNLSIVAFSKHYSILYETVPTMDITLYGNHDKTSYLEMNKIENVKIHNKNDLFNVKINEINSTKNNIKYNNKTYYEYKVNITFDVVSEQLISIDDASLLIEYNTNEKLDVKVGNIAFYKEKAENNINVHKVQGIVNDYGLYQSLAAIQLNISCDYDCLIKNISLISSSTNINNANIIIGEDIIFDHATPAKNIFGSTYNSFISTNSSFPTFEIEQNIKKDVIIPLHYTNKELIDGIGLVIEYTINNVEYVQTINSYKLFNCSNID